ncbi:hypothetical protein GE09DRAFT_58299 [Coniochaeta sp. 2T2.1]|nr:hypothetical protein GE09DRAFT_58299 [Coniochaeta sp. 2T2.1]
MGSPNNYDGVEIVEQPPQILDDDNDKPHGYCVKYIEAVRSAHFKFVVNKQSKFKRYGHHMAYNVQIDGSFTELDHEHDQESRKQVSRDPWQGITAGYFVGDFDSPEGIQEKLFRFNDLRIVEDNIPLSVEELGEERDRVKDCGTLRVSLYHMSRSDRIGNTRSLNRQLGETPPITVVNQKVLGGKTHPMLLCSTVLF